MVCVTLAVSKNAFPVFLIAAYWYVSVIGLEEEFASSLPASETPITSTSGKQDVSTLLKSTEQFKTSKSTSVKLHASNKPFSYSVTSIESTILYSPTEIEYKNKKSTASEKTAVDKTSQGTEVVIGNVSEIKYSTTNLSNGLEMTQQGSNTSKTNKSTSSSPETVSAATNIEELTTSSGLESNTSGRTEIETTTLEKEMVITDNSVQDSTTNTPSGLEFRQQESTTAGERDLGNTTPESGLITTRVSFKDATISTSNGLKFTLRPITNGETELETNTPKSGSVALSTIKDCNGLREFITTRQVTLATSTEIPKLTTAPISISDAVPVSEIGTGKPSWDTQTPRTSYLSSVTATAKLTKPTPHGGTLSSETTSEVQTPTKQEVPSTSEPSVNGAVTTAPNHTNNPTLSAGVQTHTTQQVQTTSEPSVNGVLTTAPNHTNNPTLSTAASSISTIESSTFAVIPNTSLFKCTQPGRFPALPSCTEYHVCFHVGFWLIHFKDTCPLGLEFSFRYGFCVPSRLSNCKTDVLSFSRKNGGNTETEDSSSDFDDNDDGDESDEDSHSEENREKSKRTLTTLLKGRKNKLF